MLDFITPPDQEDKYNYKEITMEKTSQKYLNIKFKPNENNINTAQ